MSSRRADFAGRSHECSCGFVGSEDDVYEHVRECNADHPTVAPRYYPDRHREGEQVDLTEWSE